MFLTPLSIVSSVTQDEGRSAKRRKRNEGISPVREEATPHKAIKAHKVRGAQLPQEYELAHFVQDLKYPHRTWNSSVPACEWIGVTCDEELRVTDIEWWFMGLKGPLQWDHLCHTVRDFSARGSKIQGSVPLDVLPSEMTKFLIINNGFSGELDFLHLPHAIKGLYLNDNKFQGCVDLTHLPATLRVLKVYLNQLSGEVDLTRLPQRMEELILTANRFTGSLNLQHLPPSLKILECNQNLFVGLVMFDRLPINLLKLDLSENAGLCGELDRAVLPAKSADVSVRDTEITLKSLT